MNLVPKTWKHFNLVFLALGLGSALFLYNFEPFHKFLLNLGSFGYLSAFVAGILYESTITVATSIVILLVLAEELSPLQIAVPAAMGAVLGDLIVFHLVKDNLSREIEPLTKTIEHELGSRKVRALKHILHTKYFNLTLPVLAAILIGSPFPNELAWGLMGMTKIKTYQVVLVSFAFNFAGIVLILSASNFLKP